ncbi:MAG TPA: hypothetical protein VFU02_06640 [Polyangiaceae bacterium]|nr:hypothetical protein [Polyangiaceae bacterium]
MVATLLLQAPPSAARPEYPEQMQGAMGLDCAPTCLLCHTVETGGADYINTYGNSLLKPNIGLGNGIEHVFGENGTIAMGNIDADMDGMNDRDEIIANTDPRTTEDVGVCSDAVYGCGAAQMAPGKTPRTSAWGIVAALGVAALLLRQLRRA